jgi:phytoene dehydrogenase-like protein
MDMRDYDAVVVGSGPNGLAAAITLQRAGLSVLVLESKNEPGGGLRTEELTLPGFRHDVCSAVHPLAIGSPFFKTLPLDQFGLQFIFPEVDAAHPFDDGSAALLKRTVEQTAESLGNDAITYKKLMQPLIKKWPLIVDDLLGPLHYPKHPFAMAAFGMNAIAPSTLFSRKFTTPQAKGLWAGMSAHSILPLSNFATSATALVLMISAHLYGWPVVRGGTGSIASALVSYFTSLGGKIKTGYHVESLDQVPSSRAVLFDVTPRQLLKIAGQSFDSFYRWQLSRYKYGPGVFKIDWALSDPIPFKAKDARTAGTVHLGNTIREIAAYEKNVWNGNSTGNPFVLLSQPTIIDPSRSPRGKHTAWAYCHVPNGSTENMTERIEKQVERFAPGFKDVILARHTFNTVQLEKYNNNYVGGDINGGSFNITQLFTRPALRSSPYRTSKKGLYICSSSTPPAGGVHGLCGYHAACRALKDIFEIEPGKK